jgi:hypothetical protein
MSWANPLLTSGTEAGLILILTPEPPFHTVHGQGSLTLRVDFSAFNEKAGLALYTGSRAANAPPIIPETVMQGLGLTLLNTEHLMFGLGSLCELGTTNAGAGRGWTHPPDSRPFVDGVAHPTDPWSIWFNRGDFHPDDSRTSGAGPTYLADFPLFTLEPLVNRAGFSWRLQSLRRIHG